MDKGRKAWRKLESLKGLHDERERREKGEHKLGRETELKLCVLTNEDRAPLNRQKRILNSNSEQ